MSVDEAIEYFGNMHKVCLALGIAPQNMTKWRKQNYIPYLQQHRIAVITEGELLPDLVDPHVNPRSKKKPQPTLQIS